MAARDVAAENEIFLGGTWFPTTGPIRAANITVVPNPIILGDTSRQTETQVVSQFIQPDASSGMGVLRANARVEFDRSWTSEAETRFSRQITLPPLVTDLGRPAGETAPPFWIGSFHGTLIVIFGVHVYTLVGTTYTLDYTLPELPTAVVIFQDRLWVSMAVAGTAFKEAPAPVPPFVPGSWTLIPENPASLIFAAGEYLYRWLKIPYFWTLRTNAQPHLPDITTGTPTTWGTAIFTGLPVDVFHIQVGVSDTTVSGAKYYYIGADAVYASFSGFNGLFPTRVRYPLLQAGTYGRTACVYQNDLVIPSGELGLTAARLGNLDPREIGLDQEDGVPGEKWGIINRLTASNRFLYALVTHHGRDNTLPRDLSVYAYDGHWHYVSGLASGLMTTAGTAVQGYLLTALEDGLYVGHLRSDGTPAIKRIDERVRSVNPKQIGISVTQTRFTYAEGPVTHTSPWFDLGSEVQSKLLLKLRVQCEATATEPIDISYQIDLDETTWIPLGTLTSTGLHTLAFNGPRGRQVRLVRLQYVLRRQTGLANSYKRPLVDYTVLEYLRLLPATWGFAVEVNLTAAYRGKTPTEMLDRLMELSDPAKEGELVEFAYKDDQGEVAQTHWAKISRLTGQEWSGRKLRGMSSYLVSVMVPYGVDSV